MMLRTLYFRHETSLRERRLVSFEGTEKAGKQVEVAPTPEPAPEITISTESDEQFLHTIGTLMRLSIDEGDVISEQELKQYEHGFNLLLENTNSTDLPMDVLRSQAEKWNTVIFNPIGLKLSFHDNRTCSIQSLNPDEQKRPDALGMNAPLSPDNTEKMDPELEATLKLVPADYQEAVRHIFEVIGGSSPTELKNLLGKMGETLGPDVLRNTALFHHIFDTDLRLLPAAELTQMMEESGNPDERKIYKFFGELSPNERALFEKIIGAAGSGYNKKTSENSGNPESHENPVSPDVQREVAGYQKRWESATTQEERDITEGFMLLAGVVFDEKGPVIDEKGNVTMHTPPSFADIVMGLIKVITAISGKLSGKETTIQKQAAELTEIKEEIPADKLLPEDRAKEITDIETDLKTSEETKVGLGKQITALKEKMQSATAEAKPGLEQQIDGMKKQLVELEVAMAKKTARLKELKKVGEKPDSMIEGPDEKIA